MKFFARFEKREVRCEVVEFEKLTEFIEDERVRQEVFSFFGVRGLSERSLDLLERGAETLLVFFRYGGGAIAAHLEKQIAYVLVILVQLVFLQKVAHLLVRERRHIRYPILLYLAPEYVVYLARNLSRFTGLELRP